MRVVLLVVAVARLLGRQARPADVAQRTLSGRVGSRWRGLLLGLGILLAVGVGIGACEVGDGGVAGRVEPTARPGDEVTQTPAAMAGEATPGTRVVTERLQSITSLPTSTTTVVEGRIATPRVVASAQTDGGTRALSTPRAVRPGVAQQQTPDARPEPALTAKPQPTPAGSPTAAPAAAPEVEPERTPTAEPVSLSGVLVTTVHTSPPTSACLDSWEWGAWQRRQSVAWGPDGSEIFFTLGGAVFVAPADGSRVRQVADAQVTAAHDAIGVEVYHPDPDADLRAVEAEARAFHRFIEEYRLGPMSAISMSPDGTQLLHSTCAYPRPRPIAVGRLLHVSAYRFNIAVLDLARGTSRRLTTGDTTANFPAWSPDGSRIAYLFGTWRLHSMRPDGSDVRDLTDGTEVRELLLHPPQWSPDGQRLAFIAVTRAGVGREAEPSLYTVRADGTEFQRLTAAVSPPSWSPDGRRLAVARPVGANAVELITMRADGTDVRPVIAIDGWEWTTGRQRPRYDEREGPLVFQAAEAWIETMAWSPAGEQILYTCGAGFCVVTTDGTPVGRSPRHAYETTEVRKIRRYASGRQPAAAWSPDGSRIAVVSWSDSDAEVILEHVAPDWTDGRSLVYAFESPGLAWAGATGERTDARRVLRARGPPTRPVAALARDLDAAANQAACATGYVVPEPEANPGLVRDCQVLAGLAPDDDGRPRWNWNAGTPVDQWEGVIVAGNPRRVTELWLAKLWPATSRALSAPEAASIAQLTELRVLNLGSTPFLGPIPAQWGSLEKLQTLVLYGSQVSGPIPPDLGNLSELRTLNLAGNKLTGSLPPDLGQLASLETLALRGNALSGAIPSAFGRLTELVTLDLSFNRLTGPLPPDLGQLASLETLDLEGNDLTGAIPSEWCQLTSISTLTLRRNRLSGPIPDCLGELPNLDRLHLEHNQLTGAIPATLAKAKRLDYAALDGNQLTGCVPPGLRVIRREELGLPDCGAA